MRKTSRWRRLLWWLVAWLARWTGADRMIAGRVILKDMGLEKAPGSEADVRLLAHQGAKYFGYYVMVDGSATCTRIDRSDDRK